ncbi:hypothetical protein ACFFSW_11185 [Saccharothrix longispora]|uniref:Uncharacterized protein n=1 Tax=Saccharothrix longispora TaxID=33920 RepID=A0ABU1Q5E4_9PSEU|nr:hypothetical protein [Saccharothrix longispora]MDR6598099.1 hypothetical protein [Saccharothrix longispora]
MSPGEGLGSGVDRGRPAARLGRGLPGWTLRAAVVAVCAAVAGVLAANGVEGLALVLYLVLAAAAAAIPASAAVALLIAYPAAAIVFVSDEPRWPAVFALVVLLHLLHLLAAYAALVPVRSRVHPEALRAPARRFAGVQLGVFALGGVVLLSPGGRTDAPVEVIGLLCALGLAVGVVLLLRRKG